MFNVPHKDIANSVKEYSRERICNVMMLTKSVPMVLNTRKVNHEHYVFNVMEARAITCFNTGNLIFKDQNPYQFRSRDKGDRWCLERACDGLDSYTHVRFECKFYKTRYVDTGEPVKDNSRYILKLNQERIERWKTPLVIPAPPL